MPRRRRRSSHASERNAPALLFVTLPLLTGGVFLFRKFVLERFHLVDGSMGFAEVVVWAVLVAAAVAACVARSGRRTVGPLMFGLVVGIALVDVLRTEVLHELGWVSEHVTMSEVLAWTFALSGAAAAALSPAVQERAEAIVTDFRVPDSARTVLYGVLWVLAIAVLCGFGGATRHFGPALFLVGVLNGVIGAFLLLPFADQPFYKGLTTFLGGVTIDNLSAVHNATAADRAIGTIAASVQRIAATIAPQFGPLTTDVVGPLKSSLWTTTGIIVATMIFRMIVTVAAAAPKRRSATVAQPALSV